MVGGGCFAYIGTYIPSWLSISSPPYSILFPQLLFHFLGPINGLGTAQWASCLVVVELKATQRCIYRSFKLRHFFDCDCSFNHSTSDRPLKIVKIIIYTFYINVNVKIILGSDFR
jgi:hypothetical protein